MEQASLFCDVKHTSQKLNLKIGKMKFPCICNLLSLERQAVSTEYHQQRCFSWLLGLQWLEESFLGIGGWTGGPGTMGSHPHLRVRSYSMSTVLHMRQFWFSNFLRGFRWPVFRGVDFKYRPALPLSARVTLKLAVPLSLSWLWGLSQLCCRNQLEFMCVWKYVVTKVSFVVAVSYPSTGGWN